MRDGSLSTDQLAQIKPQGALEVSKVGARRQNSFDALRLLLALFVLYSHAYLLGGFGAEGFKQFARGQVELGNIGVLGFFGLSGYLVSKSYANSSAFHVYLGKRIRRIFPGFLACLMVCALVLAPVIWWLRNGDLAQFPADQAFSFVWRNAALRIYQWSIGSLLDGMPYSESFNGSLWTLLPEFCCYIAVAACGLLSLNRDRRWLLIALLAYLILATAVRDATSREQALNLLPAPLVLIKHIDIYIAFVTGAACFAYADCLALDLRLAIASFLPLMILLRLGGFVVLGPSLLVILCLSLGASLRLPLRHDISYGTYIYGFPIQQLLVSAGSHGWGWLACFLCPPSPRCPWQRRVGSLLKDGGYCAIECFGRRGHGRFDWN